MSPRTTSHCVRECRTSLGIGRLFGVDGKAQTCRVRELGRKSTPPGGRATDKGSTVFSKTHKSTSNGGRFSEDPEGRSAGSLDQPVEPSSRAHPRKQMRVLCVGNAPRPCTWCERRTGITVSQCPRLSDPFGLPLALK